MKYQPSKSPTSATGKYLTEREKQVLTMNRSGMSAAQIGKELGVTPQSIRHAIQVAADKQRNLLLRDMKPQGSTLLRRARGNSKANY